MKNKNKHDHRLTNFLKVFIFMIIMLAPFFAIGVKCGYVMLNNNAKDSYRGSYAFDTTTTLGQIEPLTLDNNVSSYDDHYYKTTVTSTYFINDLFFNSNNINNDNAYLFSSNELFFPNFDLSNYDYNYVFIGLGTSSANHNAHIRLYNFESFNLSDLTIQWRTDDVYISATNSVYSFQFDITEEYIIQLFNNTNYIYQFSRADLATFNLNFLNSAIISTYFVDTTLSSVFYSAVQELDDASIFSWTTKTAIYSGLLAMSEGLGVDTPPLAVLLTYWTIITSIYIIIDIILEMFIFLTHWLNDKIC